MDYKSEFLEIFNTYVTRKGADKMLEWLERTDFFTAPASTRYHGACESGLVMHSLNVYKVLKAKNDIEKLYSDETVAIVALCHDFCKINFYTEGTRNVKNDVTGQWEKVKVYNVDDQFPFGHGEKSVFLVERFREDKLRNVFTNSSTAHFRAPTLCVLHLALCIYCILV